MKQKTGKKLLSLLFTSILVLGLLPVMNMKAQADTAYTLTYDPNGADGDPDLSAFTQSYAEGEKTTIIDLPDEYRLTKEGAAFFGWNTKADGNGTAYSPAAEIETHDNIVLYAQFDSTTEAGKSLNNGLQKTVSNDHTHDGLTFEEWTATDSLPSTSGS